MLFIAVVVVIMLLSVLAVKSSKKPKNFPPGPPKIAFLGSAPYIEGSCMLHMLQSLWHNHGPLCGFYLGNQPFLSISDLELSKELFRKDAVAARPPLTPNEEHVRGWDTLQRLHLDQQGCRPGPTFSNGSYNKELRRFSVHNLKNFGFGKASMEGAIHEEVQQLCSFFQDKVDKPFNIGQTMNVYVVNALWAILVGERLGHDDPKALELARLIDTFFNTTSPAVATITQVCPSAAKLPLLQNYTGYKALGDVFSALRSTIEPYIEQHMQSYDEMSPPRDFVDSWLQEMQVHSGNFNSKSVFGPQLGVDSLIATLSDLFIGGMDTTSQSMNWMFLYLLHHPEVKAKVHEELDLVVGSDRLPNLADRDQLPYTSAVLHEAQRCTSLAYSSIPHVALEDVPFHSYTIPKGTVIFTNLYGIMHDPKHFEDPEVFRPQRHLTPLDNKFTPSSHVVPFGVGKRSCIGQSLAENEMFLFFTAILQKFDMEAADHSMLPSYETYASTPQGVTRSAPAYTMILRTRTF